MREQLLFVDDDPVLLDSLRRTLRIMRAQWDITFANSPEEALGQLARSRFDVVVSDMRMPGMSGSQLLAAVRDRSPKAVRIILSGQADRDLIQTAIGVTHQYLAKPCDTNALREVVARACSLRALLGNERLVEQVSRLTALRAQRVRSIELWVALESAAPDSRRLSEIISRDVALTAQTLQLVNSAYFGEAHSTVSVAEAVELLGVQTLRDVFGPYITEVFEASADDVEPLLEEFNNVCITAADLCRRLAEQEGMGARAAEAFYVGALLCRVGQLVFLTESKDQMARLLKTETSWLEQAQCEHALFGESHPKVGAFLLGLWGLPREVTEAVGEYQECGHGTFDLASAVHVAHYLAGRKTSDVRQQMRKARGGPNDGH